MIWLVMRVLLAAFAGVAVYVAPATAYVQGEDPFAYDARSPLIFDHIASLTLAPDGDLLVIEPRIASIRLIDPVTLEERRVGREGAGPGEFRAPTAAGAAGRGFWVWDPGLARMTIFTADLRVDRTVRLQTTSGRAARLSSGAFVVPVDRQRRSGPPDRSLLIVESDGESVRDRISLGPGRGRFELRSGSTSRTVWQPWSDEALWAPSPQGDGFVIVSRPTSGPPRIRLRRFDARGQLVWIRDLPYSPLRIRDEDVEEQAELMSAGMLDFARRHGIPLDRRAFSAAAVAHHLQVPERLPPVTSVTLGTSGAVYLERAKRPAATEVEFWILHEAEPVSVRLPSDFSLMFADSGTLWGTIVDSFGVPRVVRYDLGLMPSSAVSEEQAGVGQD